MATAFQSPVSIAVTSFTASKLSSLAPRATSRVFAPVKSTRWRMVTQDQTTDSNKTDSQPTSLTPGDSSFDSEEFTQRMKTLWTDLTKRPFYYSTIAGYLVGGIVLLTVLRAIVSAIDSLPVLPGALELIGLGYTAWFIWRYVLFRESRSELLEEIDDFLGRTGPKSDQ